MARPLVIAHRGASGYEPENSLAAFRAAMAHGADGVELDIHNTLDGELLVHHDEQLRDGRHISRVTTPELLSHHLSNSEPIPTLTQVLSVLGPQMSVFVEIKTLAPQFDARLLETLAAGPNPAGYAIHSFDHRIVRRVGAAQASLRRGVLSGSYAIRPTIAMEDAGAKDLWQEQSLVDSALVAAVHRAGGRVLAWTANTAERMRELIQLGVDGICTNYPDVARRGRRPAGGVTRASGSSSGGCGNNGTRIAYVAALTGCPVRLTDANPSVLDSARERIESLLAGGVKRGKLTEDDRARVHARLESVPQLADAVAGADLVIEAVIEDLSAKQRLLADVERRAPPTALLATNTSSLSVGQIASALKQPGRLLGMHFFNPVHIMRLVEIVTHARTDASLVERALALARLLGKEPIVVQDSPGFASSRLGLVLGLEAMRMVEQGVATAEDIDKAMELGYNHPMGPLKLTDVVGLDVRLAIAEYLHRTLKQSQFEPPKILRDKVKKGELGKKSGRGFYAWGDSP